jgi:hypothetical protein
MKKLTILLSVLTVVMVFSYLVIEYNAIIGRPTVTGKPILSTQLVIVEGVNITCNTTFYQGWNLVSFPCLDNAKQTKLVLGYINNSYDSVFEYIAADSSDPWKSYNPELPSWVIQDLSLISKSRGYWINMDTTEQFYYDHELTIPTMINLEQGWNLIGYPSRNINRTNVTFASLIPDYTYVYAYNASDSDWKQFAWNTSLPSQQDLNYTVPYLGYWIYMLNSSTLVIS